LSAKLRGLLRSTPRGLLSQLVYPLRKSCEESMVSFRSGYRNSSITEVSLSRGNAAFLSFSPPHHFLLHGMPDLQESPIVLRTLDPLFAIIDRVGQHWIDEAKELWTGEARQRNEVEYLNAWREHAKAFVRTAMPGLGVPHQVAHNSSTQYAFAREHWDSCKDYFELIESQCGRAGQSIPTYPLPSSLVRCRFVRLEANVEAHIPTFSLT